MTIGERKSRGYQAGLVVCVVIIVVLGIGFVSTYQNLLNQINSLNADKTNLQSQINSLQAQIVSLNTTYQNYVAIHSHSNSEYDALQSTYNRYVANHHYTDSEYNALKSERDELNSIVNLQKSQVLATDKTVNLAAGKETALLYYTPYAGYVKVDFTASGNVHFWVGSTFTYTNYARYPTTTGTEASNGSFTIPVLPGTTYLYIINPSWWTGVTVTFTLTYVY